MQTLLLLLGVFACSTSVVFIKKSGVDPVLLTGFRLAIAAVVLSPLFVVDWRRCRAAMTWRHYRDAAIPGVVLTLHFITWIMGARMTPAANSSLIVNILPVVMPLFLWAMIRERVTLWELLATLIATNGLAVLFVADYNINASHLHGDLICIGSMMLFAGYMTLGRKFRHHPTVWLYLVPLYASAACVAFVSSIFLADLSPIDWRSELPWVLALGLVPTVIGHSLLNNAMRHFRGQVVSLVNMAQFVFAGIMAYPFLGEIPDASFYPASAAVVIGGVIAAKQPEPPPTEG